MRLYLAEEFLPRRSGVSRCPVDAQKVRVREPTQQFGCVMAQYHFQHELPSAALTRSGILGNLLSSSQGVCFLSGLEASFLHGLVRPYHLAQDDWLQMRQIGNSLAVPQAALVLVHCFQAAQEVCVAPSLTPVLQRWRCGRVPRILCCCLRPTAMLFVSQVRSQRCCSIGPPLRFHGQVSQPCCMSFQGYLTP